MEVLRLSDNTKFNIGFILPENLCFYDDRDWAIPSARIRYWLSEQKIEARFTEDGFGAAPAIWFTNDRDALLFKMFFDG